MHLLVDTELNNQTLAYYGTRLRYVAIRVNLSLSTQELNYIKGFPVMDQWELFLNEQVFISQSFQHELPVINLVYVLLITIIIKLNLIKLK